jgi:hypothetical protein
MRWAGRVAGRVKGTSEMGVACVCTARSLCSGREELHALAVLHLVSFVYIVYIGD